MSSQFKPLQIPPGVVAMPTGQMSSGNWANVNLMRWVEQKLSPVGGQAQYTYQFASRCRAVHGFYDLNSVFYIAYLCEQNVYVDVGGVIYDITPHGGLAAIPIPDQGGYGEGNYSDGTYGTPRAASTIQQLEELPPAFSLENFGAILLAMTSPDGRLLQWNPANGSPGVVASIPTNGAFTTASPTIQMTGSNPGSIVPGDNVFNTTSGHQVGTVLTYPTTTGTLTLTANAASAGATGDVLQFGNVMAPVTPNSGRGPVPTGRCFVVTNERFVMMFGSYDATNGGGFRRFAWCDQENFQAWDYTNVTSQAGYLDVEPASPIVTALATPLGVLFWTGSISYISNFLGIPYVYNYVPIGNNCTPWSPKSVIATSSMVLWMSKQGMFSYNGSYIVPIACQVRPWVDDDIDPVNVRWQACAVHVADFNEFWWFFPQSSVTNASGLGYNTRCIIYNYKEGWWSQGQMSRSAGVSAAYTVATIMADGLFAYQHEIGAVYPADVPLPWATTFNLTLTSGARFSTVKQLIPDVKGDAANLLYSLFYRNVRTVSQGTYSGPQLGAIQQTDPQPVRPNGYVDFRVTGRDISLKIQIAGPAVNPVTVGQHLIDAVPRGDR